MPIYEYRCVDCEQDIEAIQKFTDPPLTDCPSCGAPKLEKLLSQSTFALKGGGWYADGYGGPGSAPKAADKPGDDGAPSAKDTGQAATSSSPEAATSPASSPAAKATPEKTAAPAKKEASSS